jgi:outer membrane protein OmpA-like peptidoglycan-associated protein
MGFSNSFDPVFIGFAIKKNYFSLGVQVNTEFYGSPPKDILGLTQGSTFFQNSLNRLIDLGNIDINASSYVGYHVGYTRQINKKLSMGIRIKYLQGIYNVNIEKSSLQLSTNMDSIYIKAGFKANTAGFDDVRRSNFNMNELVYATLNNGASIPNGTDYSPDYVAFFQKRGIVSGTGWGLDFGANYKFNQHLSVSASVVDLGYINWNKNNRTFDMPTKEFNYKGADISDINSLDSIGNRFEKLQDSLVKYVFVPSESVASYSTGTNTKVYLGAQYALNYNNMFDFMFFNNFGYKTFNPAVSVAFTKKLWWVLDLRVSGTYYNKTFSNAGVGFSLNLGPFQTYLFSDNLIAVTQYDEAKFINIRTGVNWNFGRNYDRDGDGVPNKKDKCRKNYGSIELNGCPDKDKDGINDKQDSCINVPGKPCSFGCPDKDNDCVPDYKDSCVNDSGLVKLNGCPDRDNDGIADKDDKCPNDAGKASLQGCPDTDDDGVIDNEDVCPEEYGKVELDGCPDIDNDGVADYQDSCRMTPGLKTFNGCPDSDGDGIIDSKDNCPTQKGLPALNGCPDADGDGITDFEDNCPQEAGPAGNRGCPVQEVKANVEVILTPEEKKVLNEAFSNLEFETGTSTIKESSLGSLEELAELLNIRTEYKLNINGFTDNVGNAAKNIKLSESRANAVKTFLTSKGVDKQRLTAKGFGSKNPVANNKTPEGRAKNRRVEFKIIK